MVSASWTMRYATRSDARAPPRRVDPVSSSTAQPRRRAPGRPGARQRRPARRAGGRRGAASPSARSTPSTSRTSSSASGWPRWISRAPRRACLGLAVHQVQPDAGLHGDHRDSECAEDVVQLARDAQPLRGDRRLLRGTARAARSACIRSPRPRAPSPSSIATARPATVTRRVHRARGRRADARAPRPRARRRACGPATATRCRVAPSATDDEAERHERRPGSYPSATNVVGPTTASTRPDDGSAPRRDDQHDAAGASSSRSTASRSNAGCGCHRRRTRAAEDGDEREERRREGHPARTAPRPTGGPVHGAGPLVIRPP